MNNKKISDVLFKKILFMVLTIISIMSIQVDFSRLFFYICLPHFRFDAANLISLYLTNVNYFWVNVHIFFNR